MGAADGALHAATTAIRKQASVGAADRKRLLENRFCMNHLTLRVWLEQISDAARTTTLYQTICLSTLGECADARRLNVDRRVVIEIVLHHVMSRRNHRELVDTMIVYTDPKRVMDCFVATHAG